MQRSVPASSMVIDLVRPEQPGQATSLGNVPDFPRWFVFAAEVALLAALLQLLLPAPRSTPDWRRYLAAAIAIYAVHQVDQATRQ